MFFLLQLNTMSEIAIAIPASSYFFMIMIPPFYLLSICSNEFHFNISSEVDWTINDSFMIDQYFFFFNTTPGVRSWLWLWFVIVIAMPASSYFYMIPPFYLSTQTQMNFISRFLQMFIEQLTCNSLERVLLSMVVNALCIMHNNIIMMCGGK